MMIIAAGTTNIDPNNIRQRVRNLKMIIIQVKGREQEKCLSYFDSIKTGMLRENVFVSCLSSFIVLLYAVNRYAGAENKLQRD